jgi:hypothetical protein
MTTTIRGCSLLILFTLAEESCPLDNRVSRSSLLYARQWTTCWNTSSLETDSRLLQSVPFGVEGHSLMQVQPLSHL